MSLDSYKIELIYNSTLWWQPVEDWFCSFQGFFLPSKGVVLSTITSGMLILNILNPVTMSIVRSALQIKLNGKELSIFHKQESEAAYFPVFQLRPLTCICMILRMIGWIVARKYSRWLFNRDICAYIAVFNSHRALSSKYSRSSVLPAKLCLTLYLAELITPINSLICPTERTILKVLPFRMTSVGGTGFSNTALQL